MRWLHSSIARAVCCALIAALLGAEAAAQFKASIQGTVTDATGAIVPGDKVVVTNKETGRALTTTTGESGFYRVTGLAPGEYKVNAEREGFKRRELQNVTIGAETEQGVDISLEAGQISETVTISGESAPRLQTESANIDRGITEREIRRLPQFGRDPYELARLAPGGFGQGARSSSGAAKLELRANFFNAFNLLNLQAFGFSDSGVDVRNPNFGRSQRGLAGRLIEFQARFSF